MNGIVWIVHDDATLHTITYVMSFLFLFKIQDEKPNCGSHERFMTLDFLKINNYFNSHLHRNKLDRFPIHYNALLSATNVLILKFDAFSRPHRPYGCHKWKFMSIQGEEEDNLKYLSIRNRSHARRVSHTERMTYHCDYKTCIITLLFHEVWVVW